MSMQWGAWHAVGMVASSAAVLSRMRREGVGTLSPVAGLTALGRVLHAGDAAQVHHSRRKTLQCCQTEAPAPCHARVSGYR